MTSVADASIDRWNTVPAVAVDHEPPSPKRPTPPPRPEAPLRRWWIPQLVMFAVASTSILLVSKRDVGDGLFDPASAGWWASTLAMHLPFVVILLFLAGGLIERFGYFWKGRAARPPGRLPSRYPTVCVQLPMFNEHAVAERVIEAAAAMHWPIDRLSVQVLDDSTDDDTRALVDDVCARVRRELGVNCEVLRRTGRAGYKAGALEAGRRSTHAEFLVIFDSDFLPPQDFLVKAMPHFFGPEGEPDPGLALVQAQWGHLNHDESALTRAQSLWVDDHHTLQMSWRSAAWEFVNFTGTAGVWRASAIEDAGGWRAASLVEDCELSFRHLFCGYRTKFVKEIVAPAELPATYTAYKAQQRRWTQGWVQLQRMHLVTLLTKYGCPPVKRLHLAYHMCISWQWAAWAIWITMLPFMIYTGHWFGSLGVGHGLVLYVLPTIVWITVATTAASAETRHTYPGHVTGRAFMGRLGRVVPYLLINTGMLPHQFSAFCEGLFGPLHSEFERTPKAASITRADHARPLPTSGAAARSTRKPRAYKVKVHWAYVLAELGFVTLQLGWMVTFISNGLVLCALGAAYMAACVIGLAYFYGDHVGKRLFVIDRR